MALRPQPLEFVGENPLNTQSGQAAEDAKLGESAAGAPETRQAPPSHNNPLSPASAEGALQAHANAVGFV